MSGHSITSAWWFGRALLALWLLCPAAAHVDQERADACFKEAAAICQRDGGRLWGVSLAGPMVFADSRTRTIATSQPRPTEERATISWVREFADGVGRYALGRFHVGLYDVPARCAHTQNFHAARAFPPYSA